MAIVKLDFKELFKQFLASEPLDNIAEDVINNSEEITEQERKELIASLKRNEKLAEQSTGIPKLVKVNHKRAIKETLEKNPVRIDAKTGEVIKEKDDEREL